MTARATSLPDSLMAILRCPETHEPLVRNATGLVSESGAQRYDVVAQTPMLLVKERSLFDPPADPAREPDRQIRWQLRSGLRRRLTGSPVSKRNFARLAALLRPDGLPEPTDASRRRVLVVGGGILGFGMEALVDRPWLEIVETDVYLGPRTAVVCDAHDLPFADASFDAIVIQAVLEHVIDPVRVVAEAHRVLRPNGLLYSEVPFMQQVHEGAHDFTRWSLTGHRRLLRDFDELDAGAVGGPGEALAWSIGYYALALAGANRKVRRLLGGCLTMLTLPLRWSDTFLRGRQAGLDAASGTYVLGRRTDLPRADAAILDAHRGAVGAPQR